MPLYAASISEMITMPVGVLTADYIDVWCNTATDTPHKIQVGDMIAVKWNADACDREYTWCTVLATTLVASGAELTLMHEQAVDVPGHPDGEPTHVTYNWKVYTSDVANCGAGGDVKSNAAASSIGGAGGGPTKRPVVRPSRKPSWLASAACRAKSYSRSASAAASRSRCSAALAARTSGARACLPAPC